MDIVGIGSEIVEVLRIARMIERHGEHFLWKVYTEGEILFCQERRHSTEHFAARWAAKEAILKSLGATWHRGLAWTDIEVCHRPTGEPWVCLRGQARQIAENRQVSEVLLSLAHCRAYATAYAIAVGNGQATRWRQED